MKLRTIKAVVNAPYVLSEGKFCEAPGYDSGTEIYSHFAHDFPRTPENPSHNTLVEALRKVWHPWSLYQFASGHDRAAQLSAILSAVCRPGLRIAPAYFFDAPSQAAGKTKCASSLGALATGRRNGVTPYVEGISSEAETSKKIVSMALKGEVVWVIDNVVGHWRSAVLASLLTDGVINERILGANAWFNGELRMLVCATGNNASLDRDLARRFIRIRIDPKVECPQANTFPFDPVDEVLKNRMEIVQAVLLLLRGFFNGGAPQVGRGDAGFSEWNRLVRNCVLWIESEGLAADIGALGDPADSILEAASADAPEMEALRILLHGLDTAFGRSLFQAKDVLREAEKSGEENLVRDALVGMLGRKEVGAVSIGRTLRNRRDRIAGGLVLRQGPPDRNGVGTWGVQAA